ncbi:MAG: cellulase family glycosylhydrolase [Chthoniobacterales bacterium]
MFRALALAVFLLELHGTAGAAPLELHHGVGLHEWLNWSPITAGDAYVWPPYRSVADWLTGARPASDWPSGDEFVRMRKMGFDFVRLSVDPGPLLANSGARRRQALDILKSDVEQITSAGLNVVFNLHSVSQVPAYGMDVVNGSSMSPQIARYEQMTADVARMLAEIGAAKVALEPFNEPAHYPCDTKGTGDWQRVMAATVAAVRTVSADLTIVVTGACGGDITGLVDLDPSFDDPSILYSFHMYDPHSFTHQRLDDASMFGSGLPWPPDLGTPEGVIAALSARMELEGVDPAVQATNLHVVKPVVDAYFSNNFDRTALAQEFNRAATWAKANDIPTRRLYMGEFGVILMSPDGRSGAANSDRLRYIVDVRSEAEKFNMPWSIWEYSNPYGMTVIVPSGPANPDTDLLKALGLQ